MRTKVPFYTGENRGKQRLSNFCEVTQLITEGVGIRIQIFWPQNPDSHAELDGQGGVIFGREGALKQMWGLLFYSKSRGKPTNVLTFE